MTRIFSLIACIFMLALVFYGCAVPSADTAPMDSAVASSPSVETEPTDVPSLAAIPSSSPEAAASAMAGEESGLFGEINGNEYINHALKFTATAPDGWQFASDETLEQVTGLARDTTEQETELEPNASVTLMLCSKYDFLTSGNATNPNINMVFTNASATCKMLTDDDLYDQILNQYAASYDNLYQGANTQLTSERNIEINGKTYTAVYIEASFGDTVMYQDQYYTGVSDGVLITTLTYFDKADKNIVFSFMQSLKYE